MQSFEDDPLAKELECSQETCTSRPGRLLKKVRSLPVRDVETFKRKISPPPKQKTTKKREHGNLPKHDFFSALRSAQQKVFDSFEEELQAYSSFQKVSLNRKRFTSSHTITKRMTERERSRSKDRSSTGSSYHRMPQEDKVTLTKDLSRKIIFAAAKQQNRIVKLSGCQQQASEKNINIESKQNSLKSRKRKRTTIESTGSDKIDIDVDYEPIQKRRVC